MVYNTHLESGEEMELPASFIVYHNTDDKVELIESNYPEITQDRLPTDAAIGVRFYID